ncbi:MAG: hypothetical protein COB38_06500 [Gammaproteobacteria bacterium]|nr:MAG: hypothetical protein COB38_06500 [Gammaproteobacteria bacterium]
MSIIESAFLKNQKKNPNDHSDNSAQNRKRRKHRTGSQTLTNQFAIRDDIATMSQRREFTKDEYQERGLISKYLEDPKLMNEYRNLRTKLLSENRSENFIAMVTSVTPDFDPTLMTVNIASTFALDEGKTSIVINANVSSTKANDIFETETELGLVDVLISENVSIDEIIYETPINRLRYIPIGRNPESSAEYFSDIRMKKTMENILSRYSERYLFLNAPSIANSADTRILLEVCDKVLLVVPYGKCTEDNIRQAVLAIGSDKLAGIILEEF